jgi:hypothetical protein
MKIAISVLAVALLAVILLWIARPDNRQDERKALISQPESDSPTSDSRTEGPLRSGDTPRERPRLPPLSTAGSQDKPAERVQIDRRTFDPAKESDSQYERRAKLIVAFDRFRDESGISDEKAQALLALLYDWQEAARHVRKQHLDSESDYKEREALHTLMLIELDAFDALEEILTPEEMRPWRRHMESVSVWSLLNWPYEPPLIVPTE